MLTTILFDLDGTLAPFMQDDFIRVYFRALLGRLVPLGYDGARLQDALWKGVADITANDGASCNRDVFWRRFCRELGEEARSLEPVLQDFYTGEFDQVRQVLREAPDRRPLLEGLRARGYGLVLATNPIFPRAAVETRLGWVGLAASDFDWVTTYENSRFSKPSPAYYRDILARLEVPGESCLMVGNSLSEDMTAAQAGISVYLVTDCIENPGALPIDAYPHGSFCQLEAYLASLPEAKRAGT